MPDLHSTTNAIIPGMKLGYKGETSKNDIEVNVGFSCVSTFGNEYNVTDESTISQAENLKTQSSNLNSQTAQALIPYLVRTENNWLLQSVLYFSHKLSARRSCGFKLSGSIHQAETIVHKFQHSLSILIMKKIISFIAIGLFVASCADKDLAINNEPSAQTTDITEQKSQL